MSAIFNLTQLFHLYDKMIVYQCFQQRLQYMFTLLFSMWLQLFASPNASLVS